MRKSILMGTREDVIKRRANQPVRNSNGTGTSVPICRKPLMTNEQLKEFIDAGLKQSKSRIVTFNHPCIK